MCATYATGSSVSGTAVDTATFVGTSFTENNAPVNVMSKDSYSRGVFVTTANTTRDALLN